MKIFTLFSLPSVCPKSDSPPQPANRQGLRAGRMCSLNHQWKMTRQGHSLKPEVLGSLCFERQRRIACQPWANFVAVSCLFKWITQPVNEWQQYPTCTWRKHNVIITSKRRHDVVLTLWWRYYCVVWPLGVNDTCTFTCWIILNIKIYVYISIYHFPHIVIVEFPLRGR